MTAQHNFHELAAKHGFSVRETEKTCRISDTLRSISEVDFLRKRLSLYGGTALNFIHAPQTLRLSVDLDLNYRHTEAKDWGEIRAEIDTKDAISRIPIDNSLRNLLQTEATSDYDFQKIKEQVTQFTEETISNITKDETRALSQFFDHLKFEPSLIDDNSILNERIDRHPAILRTLQKLTQKRDKDREERL